MRLMVVVALLLSGCVTELLSTSQVTARTLACEVFDGETSVRIIHHGEVPEIDAPMAAWITEIRTVTGESGKRFSWGQGADPAGDLDLWLDDQVVDGRDIRLRVVWLAQLDGDVVQVLRPGIVGINVTAGAEATHALLFHGLGHALGVVNLGVPLHDVNGTTRESPPGHAGGAMSVRWHRAEDFPSNATVGYDEATTMDWKAAMADERVCA